jgi:hypothetical protein
MFAVPVRWLEWQQASLTEQLRETEREREQESTEIFPVPMKTCPIEKVLAPTLQHAK